jgi:hypothetical protein
MVKQERIEEGGWDRYLSRALANVRGHNLYQRQKLNRELAKEMANDKGITRIERVSGYLGFADWPSVLRMLDERVRSVNLARAIKTGHDSKASSKIKHMTYVMSSITEFDPIIIDE